MKKEKLNIACNRLKSIYKRCPICNKIIWPQINITGNEINVSLTSCEIRGGPGNKIIDKNLCSQCWENYRHLKEVNLDERISFIF